MRVGVYAIGEIAIGVKQIFRRDAEEFADSSEQSGVSDERALSRDHVRPACSRQGDTLVLEPLRYLLVGVWGVAFGHNHIEEQIEFSSQLHLGTDGWTVGPSSRSVDLTVANLPAVRAAWRIVQSGHSVGWIVTGEPGGARRSP